MSPTSLPSTATLGASLRIDELRLFMQVAKLGSFSQVAQLNGINQSTVSKRIKKLESSLGLLLFERSSREVVLSDVGEVFLTYCQDLLDQFDSTLNFVLSSQDAPVGRLTIGMPPWMAMVVGGEFFAQFRQLYPQLRLSLMFTTRERLIEGDGIDIFFGLKEPMVGQYRLDRLAPEIVTFYASQAYLDSHPPIHHPKQLAQHECLCYRNPYLQTHEWLWPDEQGQVHTLNVTPGCDFEYIALGVDMARHHGGIIWAPNSLVKKLDPEKQLVPVFGDQFASNLHIIAIHPHHNVLPPKIRVLIDELKKYLTRR